MATPHITSTLRLTVDGNPLANDLLVLLAEAYVDDNLHLPDMFSLRFRDPDRLVVPKAGIQIGSKVEISVVAAERPSPASLMVGEVTALEAEVDGGGTYTTVRGFDASHRLLRGSRTMSYTQVTYADIVRTVAKRNSVGVGTIDSPGTVHENVTQANLPDWAFLHTLAAEIGYELSVEAGNLNFTRPSDTTDAAEGGDNKQPHVLELGADVRRLRAAVSAAGQVPEVEVRSWDDQTQQAVVARRPARTSSAKIGVEPLTLAERFTAPTLVTTHAVHRSQSSIDATAEALADRVAGTFAEMEGVVRGNPALRAGTAVSITSLGVPFDGRYVLTRARHVFLADTGYATEITVSGKQERSLYGLTAGGNKSAPAVAGLATGVVTDVRDPEHLGRVRLRLPWLDDSYTTAWARVVQPGAGPDRGAAILPEVGDEVLVAFAHGDLARPFVVGGLHSASRRPSKGSVPDVDDGTGEIVRRGFVSRTGHRMEFLDGQQRSGIVVQSSDHKLEVALDVGPTTLTVRSDGTVVVKASKGVSIDAGSGGVTIAGGEDITLRAAGGVTLDAGGGDVRLKGVNVDVIGSAQAKLSAPNVSVDGGALCEITAPMVRIN
ncbi:VgrG-related protein [Kribbella sp. CA-253562]|uniref:VgrG-related protein n=1 Tax=Kribbella sp. CA-253562 TaxID=3239942 RepID=UPI003D8C0653